MVLNEKFFSLHKTDDPTAKAKLFAQMILFSWWNLLEEFPIVWLVHVKMSKGFLQSLLKIIQFLV